LASTLFSKDLLEKYALPEETVSDAVSLAISKTLGKAMRTTVFSFPGESGFEIYAIKQGGDLDDPVIKVKPETIKPKLLRHLQYSIERALNEKMVQNEFDRYRDLQSQIVKGVVTGIAKNGTVEIELEREVLFDQITLRAICPLRYQPQHERGKYKSGQTIWFHVSKIRPSQVRGMARLEIILDRTSNRVPEGLIRKAMEARSTGLGSDNNHFKCVKRICGAFSQIQASKRIDREIIQLVSRELKENVFVKFGEQNRHK